MALRILLYRVARILLSPKHKWTIERHLWEKEKLFDSIAALVLQCEASFCGGGGENGEEVYCHFPMLCNIHAGPDIEGIAYLIQKNAVGDLMSLLNLTPFCIIGE